jgi:hypothetical protein
MLLFEQIIQIMAMLVILFHILVKDLLGLIEQFICCEEIEFFIPIDQVFKKMPNQVLQ